jgi:hypothetical protein
LLLCCAAGAIFLGGEDTPTETETPATEVVSAEGEQSEAAAQATNTSQPANTNTPQPVNTNTPQPTPTQEVEGLVKEGTHLIGTDIEPGIYVGQAGEDPLNSCYWARLSNLTGSDDILANDNAQGLYYVEVLPDDKALETGCELLPIEQVPARDEFLTVLPPGTYLLGRDIEAGTYRGEAGDEILESCYWARLSNVSGEGNVIANDNATGQYFIEVLPTDFALEVDCEVEKVE